MWQGWQGTLSGGRVGNPCFFFGVPGGAGRPSCGRPPGHLHVHVAGGFRERAVEVAVLHVVAAAAEEVTGAAILTTGHADSLRDLLEVDSRPLLSGLGRKLRVHVGRVAGRGGEFLVRAGRVMADEAVDVLRLAEVEARVLPPIAGVTARAARLVRRERDAEVVHRVGLAKRHLALAFDLLPRAPGPVDGLHEIAGLIRVALQASSGDVGPRLERALDEGRMVLGSERLTSREDDGRSIRGPDERGLEVHTLLPPDRREVPSHYPRCPVIEPTATIGRALSGRSVFAQYRGSPGVPNRLGMEAPLPSPSPIHGRPVHEQCQQRVHDPRGGDQADFDTSARRSGLPAPT